jgi:hypothetical protein
MTQEGTSVNDGTDPSETSQAQNKTERTYSQKEFDDHMARMKTSLQKKYERVFEELGDLDELKQLKSESERRKVEDQKKRGDYEKIIQELAERKDQEIRKRDEIIRNYTIDTPLLQAAAQMRSVNPEQVKHLLKPNLRLNDAGEVEVLDNKGQVKFNDRGTPYRVEDLVGDFLKENPHFVAPPPSTTNGRSNISQGPQKLDLKSLDMKNPEHRKLYKEARSANKQ